MNDDLPPEHIGLPTVVARLGARIDAMDREAHLWRTETSAEIRQVAEAVNTLSTKLADSRAVNWLPLASVSIGATLLVITLGTLTLSPTVSLLTDVRKEFAEHIKLPLHREGSIKVEAMDERLSTQALQNKELVKLLESLVDQRLNALNKEIAEIRAEGSPITRDRLNALEHDLAWMRGDRHGAPKKKP